MPDLVAAAEQSEAEFVELVGALAADPARRELLVDLLREDHPFYNQRSATTVVQMRGWILLSLARTGVSDRELPFVLEEFDAGTDAYLVGAAARALRSYSHPSPTLVPFLMRALTNIRDEPLSFENYGEYATADTGTTAVRELLASLAWIGPQARSALPELTSMRAQLGRLSRKLRKELDQTIAVIRAGGPLGQNEAAVCCTLPSGLGQKWWAAGERENTESLGSILFEDQDGTPVRFQEFFHGHASIVVFFYTRCDNPLKCSLTVTKLASVQQLLQERALTCKIQTAAITYDPFFDIPKRLRDYGRDRGISFDAHHRMLRATEGFSALRNHFKPGVNFIESLVNRHRIELYILDSKGRVSARFERIHWDESQVVARATEVLREDAAPDPAERPSVRRAGRASVTVLGTLASLVWAFFPKCPLCWAAYLSIFGMAGTWQIPYPSKMQPVLVALMLINIVSTWFRVRSTRRLSGFYLVCAGALAIVLSKIVTGWDNVAIWGVALTFAGTLWNAVNRKHLGLCLRQILIRATAQRVYLPER